MHHKERRIKMAKWLVVMVISLMASVLGAAGATPEALKVGFIYVGPVGDYGWSYAHDQGRKYLETALPDVKTTYVESVPEGADAERVLRQLARSGHKDRCDQLRLYGYNVKGGRTLS
jgi:basic membrane protein A and related proteins